MELSLYLISYLGKLNEQLGYTSGSAGDLALVVEDAVNENGGGSADSTKLRTLGKFFLWKKVLVDVSGSVDFSADGSSFKMSQLYDFCERNYLDSLVEASPYLSNSPYGISVQNYTIATTGSEVSDEYSPYC